VADVPNEQAALDPDFQPEDVRLIGDVESLRAISDPTRLRILETMVQRRDPAWSVKELAAEIGLPQTRLYHHVDLLLERDLIRAVERRVVSGIIETRYRVVAKSFQLDRRLLAGDSEAGRQVSTRPSRQSSTPPATDQQSIRTGPIDMSGEAPPSVA
jgi:DNA-binding transcriptional ArsR family regulator